MVCGLRVRHYITRPRPCLIGFTRNYPSHFGRLFIIYSSIHLFADSSVTRGPSCVVRFALHSHKYKSKSDQNPNRIQSKSCINRGEMLITLNITLKIKLVLDFNHYRQVWNCYCTSFLSFQFHFIQV